MPIILYTLIIALLMPFVLAWLAGYYRVKQFGHFDNHHPRQQQAGLDGVGARIHAAQLNAWEALSVYGVTVFIAFAQGVDLASLTTPALIFITMRLLHAVFYISNLALLRSVVFVVAMACCFYIIYLAM